MTTLAEIAVGIVLGLAFCVTAAAGPWDCLQTRQPSPWECLREPLESRSPKWESLSRKFREAHPTCAACGKRGVDAHHVLPVHVRPDMELDESNLVSLCPTHHLQVGHNGNWRDWNPRVREDAAKMLAKRKSEPVGVLPASSCPNGQCGNGTSQRGWGLFRRW